MEIKRKYLNNLLQFALRIVRKTESITLKYYNKKLGHKVKKNLTPVTIADLKCEQYLISKIREEYPSHSLLTEETGKIDNNSEFKWIIDPIDGTKNYMRKYPSWGTLLALEYQSEVILGVISMPSLREIIYAVKGGGCYFNKKKAKVSKVSQLKKSYCIFGSLEHILIQPYRNNFLNIINSCYYTRGYGDCHGHSFVINGRAEVMIDPVVAPYDIAAVKICVEEAGGLLTDINGNRTIYSGNAIVSNGVIHEELLKLLNYGFESREITK